MNYALITGASSGIGRCYAHNLASRGYGIIAVSNQDKELSDTVAELKSKYGINAHAICIDLTAEQAAQSLHKRCQQEGWRVDILVCNAGMLLFSTLASTEPMRLKRIIDLHCTTTTLLCRYFGEDMKLRRSGHILIMSSATAWMPYPTISHYSATKAYLNNFASALWYEMRPYRVSVTTVYPGAVDTPFYTLGSKMRKALRLAGVMLSPQSIAKRAIRAMFRNRRRVVPGLFTKVVVAICSLLPHFVLYPLLRIYPIKQLLERV